jgi:hypothetical protein
VCVKVAVCFKAGLNITYTVNLLHHTNNPYLESNAVHFKAVSLVTYTAIPVNAPSFKAFQNVDCLKNGRAPADFALIMIISFNLPPFNAILSFFE